MDGERARGSNEFAISLFRGVNLQGSRGFVDR